MTKTVRNSKQLVLEPLIFQPNQYRPRVNNIIQNNPSIQRNIQKISNSSSLERPKFVFGQQSQKVILTFKIELLNEQISELHYEIQKLESQLQESLQSLNSLCDTTEDLVLNNKAPLQ
ncbi:Hypothetical_protein [Hexamita inflata]|uniref:Hypothetical_protein n=1 Tax=Hexamita inflata TaxID=28002 RepID=A0AA86QL92_9EUKA|nr:Hypothetical protein HINF_LOCUS47953 [Hexamita inflata]